MTRVRTSPSKRLWLTDRDQRLLCDLLTSTVMTRDQLIGLNYFSSIPRLNLRLRLLCDGGYVRRVEGTRLGTRQTLYACGPAAAPVVCLVDRRPLAEVEQRLRRSPGLLFLEHTLRITDVRIALLNAARCCNGALTHWLSEAQCFHEYSVSNGVAVSRYKLKPDGFARIAIHDTHQDIFVEADCGNVSLRRFAEKVAAYNRYYNFGVFHETYKSDAFRVLVVTTGTERAHHLQALAKESAVRFDLHVFDPHGLGNDLTTLFHDDGEVWERSLP